MNTILVLTLEYLSYNIMNIMNVTLRLKKIRPTADKNIFSKTLVLAS